MAAHQLVEEALLLVGLAIQCYCASQSKIFIEFFSCS